MNSKTTFANLALLLAAFFWGTTFVAQSVGMEHIEPFTFLFARSFIGAAALLIVSIVGNILKKRKGIEVIASSAGRRVLLTGGVCCGLALCAASGLQQTGMQYTTVGNAGFITSMYMLIVPVLSLFLGKKVPRKHWVCIFLAATGLYFLSITDTFSISKGDAIMVVCAFFFALHIMIVDYFAPRADCVKLSCMQFLVTGILSLVLAVIFENPLWENIVAAKVSIVYAGVFSSGVAFTLQIVAQKYAKPAIATLFMSMESVFSLLGGIVVLHQIPSGREAFGCCLVLCGVLVSQISRGTAGQGTAASMEKMLSEKEAAQ